LLQPQDKQPKSLYLLFFTEAWERFGFYTLQTIIVLYMSKQLLFSDDQSYQLYAIFSALIYLTPVIGGYLADRVLGYQRAVIIGGVMLTLGYGVMIINTSAAFFAGLAILITANGFFKANVSSLVGTLYERDDPRRQGGFTLFYMGINIGSLFPPLIAGVLVHRYGWHSGFLMASIGMLLGLVTFLVGRRMLADHGSVPRGSPLLAGRRLLFYTLFYVAVLGFTYIFYLAFQHPQAVDFILEFSGLAVALVVGYFIFHEHADKRRKLIASVILIIISVGFWALYNQTFTSLMLYADRNMAKPFMGIQLTAEMTQFFNPFFIIVLSPLLSRLWLKLGRHGHDPSIPTKFAFGVLFMAAGFIFLSLGGQCCGSDGIVSPWWLVGSYFLQTVGELLISPIGLSMVTVLSPPKLVGMMMGVWFFAQAESAALAGFLARFSAVPDAANLSQALGIYDSAFMNYGLLTLGLGVVAIALIPFLKKMIANE
tara:strand:+ start:124 stop:1572 length:1449 start_codon:yes stop_codon:yes gene_type:complete